MAEQELAKAVAKSKLREKQSIGFHDFLSNFEVRDDLRLELEVRLETINDRWVQFQGA